MMATIAAIIILVILFLLSVFQFALILGAPIGRFAWGGQHDVLPTRLRIGSAASVLIYLFMAVLVASKVGTIEGIIGVNFMAVTLWAVTSYLAIGIVMNAISRSKPERYVMTPTLIMLVTCFAILATA